MKKILFIFTLFIVTLAMAGCSDDDYTIDEAYEKAEITNVTLYNRSGASVSDKPTIDSEVGTVFVTVKSDTDITDLKMVANISTGATLTPGMATGFQNCSSPFIYTVTSPGKTIVKQWTITVTLAQ